MQRSLRGWKPLNPVGDAITIAQGAPAHVQGESLKADAHVYRRVSSPGFDRASGNRSLNPGQR